jgi:hypothetical protein
MFRNGVFTGVGGSGELDNSTTSTTDDTKASSVPLVGGGGDCSCRVVGSDEICACACIRLMGVVIVVV